NYREHQLPLNRAICGDWLCGELLCRPAQHAVAANCFGANFQSHAKQQTMTEDHVDQDTYAKFPKTRPKKPLPAKRNETIEEKHRAGFGRPAEIEYPQHFFRKSLFE